MSQQDDFGNRMKDYEDAFRHSLPIRMPVILRLDGCHMHTTLKDCKKPFDDTLIDVFNQVGIYLCEEIQGAQIAYLQSDEISILVNNYKELNTQSWFKNNIQKMVSVSAAMASAKFTSLSHKIFGETKIITFDSRVFILPKEEVCNAFLWRQNDSTRNSIQMVARSLYSHNECNNKNTSQLQEMAFQKGINWNDLPTHYKRGRCIVKKEYQVDSVIRHKWEIDNDIPVFSKDRNYIEKYI